MQLNTTTKPAVIEAAHAASQRKSMNLGWCCLQSSESYEQGSELFLCDTNRGPEVGLSLGELPGEGVASAGGRFSLPEGCIL